jgi:hypothetical protein
VTKLDGIGLQKFINRDDKREHKSQWNQWWPPPSWYWGFDKSNEEDLPKRKTLNLKVEQSNVGGVSKSHLGITRVSQFDPFQASTLMIPTLMP